MKNIFCFQKIAFKFPYFSKFQFSNSYKMRNNKISQNWSIIQKFQYKNIHSSITKLINHVNNTELSKVNSYKMIDTLVFNLEREDLKQFKENFNLVHLNKILLTNEDINRILNLIYKKHFNFVDELYDYSVEYDVKLNSLNYYFFINSNLENKNFMKAYALFLQANYEKVPIDLTTIFNLYIGLKTQKEKDNLKEYIDFHIAKNYDTEIQNIVKDFHNIQPSECIKNKHFKKIKKSKKKTTETNASEEANSTKMEINESKPIEEISSMKIILEQEAEKNLNKVEEIKNEEKVESDNIMSSEDKSSKKEKKKIKSNNEDMNEVEYLNYKYFQKLQKQNFQHFMKLIMKLQHKSKYQPIDIRIIDTKDLKDLNFDNDNGDFSDDE